MYNLKVYDERKLEQKTFVLAIPLNRNINIYDKVNIYYNNNFQFVKTIVSLRQVKLKDVDNFLSHLDKNTTSEIYQEIMLSYGYNLDTWLNFVLLSDYTSPQTILDAAQINYQG